MFKADDFKNNRGISKFALYYVMLTGRTQEIKISLFDLLSMFYPININ